jgi:toxin ParE1/3/4
MVQVHWTKRALNDLSEIMNHVAQDSPARAVKLVGRLLQATNSLEHSPKMGRIVSELGMDHVRELVSGRPYRIVYQIRDDTCTLVLIFHSSRSLAAFLRQGHRLDS